MDQPLTNNNWKTKSYYPWNLNFWIPVMLKDNGNIELFHWWFASAAHIPCKILYVSVSYWCMYVFLCAPNSLCLWVNAVWKVQVTNHKGPLGSTPIDFLRHLTDITLTLMGGFHILNSYRTHHNLLWRWLSSLLSPSEVWTPAITLSGWVRRM